MFFYLREHHDNTLASLCAGVGVVGVRHLSFDCRLRAGLDGDLSNAVNLAKVQNAFVVGAMIERHTLRRVEF